MQYFPNYLGSMQSAWFVLSQIAIRVQKWQNLIFVRYFLRTGNGEKSPFRGILSFLPLYWEINYRITCCFFIWAELSTSKPLLKTACLSQNSYYGTSLFFLIILSVVHMKGTVFKNAVCGEFSGNFEIFYNVVDCIIVSFK